MILQEDNHPLCAADDAEAVGDRARFCDDGVCDEDDDGVDGDDEVWLAAARLGRLIDRAGVDGFFADGFLADFLLDAAGVTADLGFFADLVGVRDLDRGRLAGDAFFAVDFLADRDGVGLRPGVDGVADEDDGFGAGFLPGVLAMMVNFVSSDLSSLFMND